MKLGYDELSSLYSIVSGHCKKTNRHKMTIQNEIRKLYQFIQPTVQQSDENGIDIERYLPNN